MEGVCFGEGVQGAQECFVLDTHAHVHTHTGGADTPK